MAVKNLERCSRCYHELPPGKNTWGLYWSLWSGGPNGLEKYYSYHSDSPSYGKIQRMDIGANITVWRAWVINKLPMRGLAWPEFILLGTFGTLKNAKNAVEVNIRRNEIWL